MLSPEFDFSSDCFLLYRDQDTYLQLPQAQSKQKVVNAEKQTLIGILYEIIKTDEGHIVLHHEVTKASLLHTAQEDQPTIRCFTVHNPVITDDEFMIPPRNYEHTLADYSARMKEQLAQSLSALAQLVFFGKRLTRPGYPMIR